MEKLRTAQRMVYFFGLYMRTRSLRLSLVRYNTRLDFLRYILVRYVQNRLLPVKVKSNAHIAIWHFSSSSIEPLQFGYYSILNFLVYSRIDFHP